MQSHADIATTLLVHAPYIAATAMRGGILALPMKLRHRPQMASEQKSLQRTVRSFGSLERPAMLRGQHLSSFDRARPSDGERVAVEVQAPGIATASKADFQIRASQRP